MLATILSLPVSIALIIWIARLKRNDPFPRFSYIKLLVAGAISGLVASAVGLAVMAIKAVELFGLENITAMLKDPNSARTGEILKIIQTQSRTMTFNPVRSFISTFLLIGLVEEVFKFLLTIVVIRKNKIARTRMDRILCLALVAIGFQVCEDIAYAGGSIVVAVMRALTPFHFTLATVMGYYYSKYKVTGRKLYGFLAIFVPSFLHTLFDFSIKALTHEDIYIVLVGITTILLLAITIIMIRNITRWKKNGTLDYYIDI